MIGLMQIMIYLLCIYLVYKGVEIFQIALVSNGPGAARKVGIAIGILSTVGAVVAGAAAVFLSESIAEKIGNNMNTLPKF